MICNPNDQIVDMLAIVSRQLSVLGTMLMQTADSVEAADAACCLELEDIMGDLDAERDDLLGIGEVNN